MRVGIVGTGHIGSGIARFLAAAGHEVVISSRSGDGLEALASELSARVATPAEAAAASEVVVLAVPWIAMDATISGLGGPGALADRIVIDTTNQFGPLPDGRFGVVPLGDASAAATNAAKAPEARWAKAFNTLTAGFQRESAGRTGDDRVVMFYATDDERTAPVVASLIDDAGFDAVRTGTLARVDVGHQEPKGDLYGEEFHRPEATELVARLRGTPPSGTGRP